MGLFEKAGWFGHGSGNAETPQSPERGRGCEDQVVHPARRRGGTDGPRGPAPAATLYLQKQSVQARFLYPNILGAVGAG